MDIKNQIIEEYLSRGSGFRALAKKYGISTATICKWVSIYQGIHNLPPTEKQQKYSISSMNKTKKKVTSDEQQSFEAMQQKIALLEKQVQFEKLRADALDTMINVAEDQLNISIRKKPGTQQSEK